MVERNYPESFAEQIYRQIEGFADYGFPESHAASFALLAYVSAWFKYHEPAVFTCALLNSQPMGFYAPSQLVQDARRHGVRVLPVDVCYSDWDSTLEPDRMNKLALRLDLRLGLHQVKGLHEDIAGRIVAARRAGQFTNVNDLARRAKLSRAELQRLSAADALATLSGNRHRAQWQALGVEEPLPALTEAEPLEGMPLLKRPTEYKDIVEDYRMLGLSLRRHPMKLLRDELRQQRWRSSNDLKALVHGSRVAISGIVISRQRPGSATGVVFVTLEDEFGHANIIVWNSLVQSQRKELLNSTLLGVLGEVQRDGKVIHVVAHRLVDLTGHLQQLSLRSRDFH